MSIPTRCSRFSAPTRPPDPADPRQARTPGEPHPALGDTLAAVSQGWLRVRAQVRKLFVERVSAIVRDAHVILSEEEILCAYREGQVRDVLDA